MANRPLHTLALAYACEPGKGSEPGAGWVWARMLARMGEAWVLTRRNNRDSIEAALVGVPERERLHFVYVDLPAWARFWKRGPRGARLYYLLWQVVALRRARGLERQVGFDLVWHLTMSTVWLGSTGPLLGRPFVFGPVGGGVGTPPSLRRSLGMVGVLSDTLRDAVRVTGRYLNPLARLAWRRAALILAQNPSTIAWLPRRHRHRAVVFPHVVLDESVAPRAERFPRVQEGRGRTAVFAGRLLPWKGGALALQVMARLPDWRLLVCGAGPDEARLRRRARHLGVAERIQFLGWQSPAEVRRIMGQSDVLLFPSLHDEAGWVVVEALAEGLPVVCLDWGGPPVLGGKGVPVGTVDETVKALARSAQEAVVAAPHADLPLLDRVAPRLEELVAERLGAVLGPSREPAP